MQGTDNRNPRDNTNTNGNSNGTHTISGERTYEQQVQIMTDNRRCGELEERMMNHSSKDFGTYPNIDNYDIPSPNNEMEREEQESYYQLKIKVSEIEIEDLRSGIDDSDHDSDDREEMSKHIGQLHMGIEQCTKHLEQDFSSGNNNSSSGQTPMDYVAEILENEPLDVSSPDD